LDEQGFDEWAAGCERSQSVLALTDAGPVLFRVATAGLPFDGIRMVAWDPSNGRLSLVSRTNTSLDVSFADGLLPSSGS
jgi:hypothetical protein